MKNFKSTRRKIMMAMTVVISIFSLSVIYVFAAGTKQYKFTNNEDSTATDIRIGFVDTTVNFHTIGAGSDPTVETPAGSFKDGNIIKSIATSEVTLAKGFTGSGVPVGGSLVISLDYGGASPPNVLVWSWTKGNSLTTHIPLGVSKQGKENCFEFSMAPSAGNGLIAVTIDGSSQQFQVPSGVAGNVTANSFAQFINTTFPFGNAFLTSPNSVKVSSTALSGNFAYDFQTTILQQDALQQIIMQDCTTPATLSIPTLSEWGLIALGVLVLLTGVFFVRRMV